MNTVTAPRVAVGVLAILLAGTSCASGGHSTHEPAGRRPVFGHPPPPDGNPVHVHLAPFDDQSHSKVLVDTSNGFENASCVAAKSCYVYLEYVDANYAGESAPTCLPGADACLSINSTGTSSDSPFVIESRKRNGHTRGPSPVNGQFVLVLSSNPLSAVQK
jgi:hypothetical protein